jgi:hypothetical protein
MANPSLLIRASRLSPAQDPAYRAVEERICLAQLLCDLAGVHSGPGEVFAAGSRNVLPIVGALPYCPRTGKWGQVRTFGHLPFGHVTISGHGINPVSVDVSTPEGERIAVKKLRELRRPTSHDTGWRRLWWGVLDALDLT